jgi:hypothetical protein
VSWGYSPEATRLYTKYFLQYVEKLRLR